MQSVERSSGREAGANHEGFLNPTAGFIFILRSMGTGYVVAVGDRITLTFSGVWQRERGQCQREDTVVLERAIEWKSSRGI